MREYNSHFNRKIDDEKYESFLSFDQWETFYNADPENWHWDTRQDSYETFFWKETKYYNYYIVYYRYPDKHHHFIKFLTKRDYKKFKKYIEKHAADGTDWDNEQEILKLSQMIGNIATKRLEEAQKELQNAYHKNKQIMEKASQNLLPPI